MLISRKIGKLLRGNATPLQIVLASTIGGMLGFIPGFFLPGDVGGGFLQAPGLILSLFLLILVLNANFGVFGLATMVAKLLSFVLLPVSFAIGRFLLDGPTSGLYRALVNAPVLAWFGLERYATSGGLALGLVFGLLTGFLFVRGLRTFRERMSRLEEGSEAWRKYTGKWYVRMLTWLFLGGKKHKLSWRELTERPASRNPIRVPGLIFAVVVVAALWLAQTRYAEPLIARQLQEGLEDANGATVDLQNATVDLARGRIALAGLAMADPNDPTRDLVRAARLEADVSTQDLLRRRIVMDRLVSDDASTGEARATPGRVTRKPEAPPSPPAPPGDPGKTVEDWMKDAEKWKERLAQARDWLKKLTARPKDPVALEQEIREAGYARVIARHLIEGAPSFLLRELRLDGVRAAQLPGEVLDIHGSNLSTDPALVKEPPKLTIRSRSGTLKFDASLTEGGTTPVTDLSMQGLSVDTIAGRLRAPGGPPVRGGTLGFELRGKLIPDARDGFRLDLPMLVHLQGTTLNLAGAAPTPVEKLTLPLGVSGPLTGPKVTLDAQALANALTAAGKAELAKLVNEQAGKLGGEAGKAAAGLLQGAKTPEQIAEEAKKKIDEEAKKQMEELKKKLPIPFGGKKDENKKQ